MISRVMKRMSAIIMVFVLIMTSTPMQSFGATSYLLDGNKLKVDYTSATNKTVTVSNGVVELNAKTTSSTSCGITSYSTNTANVTITNNSGSTGTLKFSYKVDGHSDVALINGTTVTGSATYAISLQAEQSIEISITSKDDATGTAIFTLSGFELVGDTKKNVRFLKPVNGKIFINGEEVNEEKTVSATFDEGIAVKAESDSGYQFLGWVNEENEILSSDTETRLQPTADETVHALFAEISGQAYFKVGTKVYQDLGSAAEYANNSAFKTIVPIIDGSVAAGNYTIPKDVTLLIPFDAAETSYKDNPESVAAESYQQPWAFRTLTLDEGANLTVLGDLSVSAKHISGTTNAGGASLAGAPTGAYGHLHLAKGSTVSIGDDAKNPGNLYAWGFVTGEGNIVAKPAAKVYENLQITDWRGGSQSTSMDNRVFPFSQFYVQNIEAPITFEAGAVETVRATVEITFFGATSAAFNFVASENALFNISSGSMTKSYDAQTDRLNLDINGDAELKDVSLKVSVTIQTRDYDVPITSNMSINAKSGTTTIRQNLAFLPGATVSIDEGASVKVAEKIGTTNTDCAVYVYDNAEWKAGYTYPVKKVVPVVYSPTVHPVRTGEELESVKVDINGNLDVEGALYTTESGASIISSGGTGVVNLINEAPANTTTKQLVQQAADGYAAGTYVDINVTPAKLQNADGSYTETAGSAAGTYFKYINGKWKSQVGISYNANGGTGSMEAQTISVKDFEPGVTPFELKANTFTREGYDFTAWNTQADGRGTAYNAGITVKPNDSLALYAQWAPIEYTATFNGNGGSVSQESVVKAYGTPLGELPAATRDGYTFDGWFTAAEGGEQITKDTTMPLNGATYYAQWTPVEYTATFDGTGGSASQESIVKAYETPLGELPTASRTGYTFDGWFTAAEGGEQITKDTTMPLNGATYYAQWTPIDYSITYDLAGGSLPDGQTNPEGYNVESDDITLVNPAKKGFDFLGWTGSNGEEAQTSVIIAKGTTGDKSYTAQWGLTEYAIKYDLNGGTLPADSPEKYTIESEDITLKSPVREGYTFLGWTGSNGEEAQTSVTIAKGTTGDKNYTAQWEVVDYAISYDLAGGFLAEDQTNPDGYNVESETITLLNPTKTGYTFAGWTGSNGEEAQTNVTISKGTTGDKNYTAQWTANTYEVQFDGNGSTSGEMKNQAFTYDVAQELTENAFVRQYTVTYDYNNADGNIGDPSAVAEATFNGWKTADTTYGDKDSVKNLTAEKGGVVTLVADWTLGTVHLPTPTRTGYDFDGWAVQNANTRSLYNGEYVPETDVTLVAQWTPIVYDITYDLDEELVGEGAALPEGTPTSYTIESEDFTLNHPTVEGYTFTGWTVEGFEEPQMTVVIEQGTIGDKTYKANWEINQHTVTYDALDGSEPQTITLNYGEEIPENVLADTESHIFDGWFVTLPGEGEAEEPMPAAMPDKDLVVKAHWVEKEEVTLTFDTDGGSAVEPLIGYVGGKLTLPDAPEKTGHTFAGWFNEAGENVSEKENPRYPFENETYTAHWTVNSYQVSFDSDGGSAVDPIFVPYNTKAEAPETVPVKPGYTFQGWDSLPENMPAEDITVKAIWKANQFVTVTFNNHKGVPMMEFGDLHGKPFEKPEDPTRLGYEFAGWIDEEGNEYNLTIYPEKDMTFTATWTPIDYTITFDTDGGSTVAPMTLHYGDAITAPAEPTKEGYDFFAWYDVENEEYVNIPKTMPARDMNLKAVWSINQYTITFDTDGGSKVKPIIQDYGTAVTAPKAPEKEGYSFVGWEPSLPETMPATDTAVKAVWETVPYAIEYDLDGGVLPDGYPTEYTIESETITLPNPAKDGYTFDGWTGSNGKRPEKDVTIKTGTTGDMSYTAHWTANTYEVQFDGNGATSGEMNKQEFTYDVAQNLTENAFGREYTVTYNYNGSGAEAEAAAATATFNGWAETAGGDKVYDDKQEVSNLATEGTYDLYANWTLGTVTLPTPEREGYEFAGWTAGEDGTGTIYDGGDTYTPVDDTTLYAQWTANTYEVQFDGNGATSGTMENQKFIYDAAQNLTENAFGREYTVTYNYNGSGAEDTTAAATATFNGWATAADGDKVYNDKQEVSNLVTEGTYDLYANWTLGKVTLPTPERTGYEFAGWTIDAEGKDFVQGETYTPEKDMTLYAQWTANEFDVHFDGNGATSGEMKNQAFTYDVAQNLTENAFDREYTVTYNYNGNGAEDTTAAATATFNGWAESAKGEKVYDDKQEVSNLATEGTYDLYANWTLGTVTLPKPERTGYTFTGWTVNADGTGTVYNGGDVYTPVEDITFYAQWSINKYTATFDANGGSEAVPVTITKIYGAELGDLPTTVRPGHTFNGWFTAAEEGELITADTTMPAGDVTYYAQWTLNKHTITFDSANGNPPVVIEQYYGTEATVADAPEKEGHTFAGWNTKADGTGTAYEPGDKFELTANVELFAQWTVNQYKLTFDANGGSEVAAIEQDYGTKVTAPADPTRKGYTFAGWDGDIPKTMPAENLNFTAKWNINQYTATFESADGSGNKETITQDYDTDVTVPEAPEREGYTFQNWNTEADGTGKAYQPDDTIRLEDADITLYAQWSINQYTIKFDTDGGSEVAAMVLDYGAEVKDVAEPAKYGYIFAGWEPALPETMPAKDLEVKAKWVEREKYTATFTDHNGNILDVFTGLDGEKIPVPADPTREGYTFAGWTPAVPETYPEANTTYVAQWTVNEYKATFDANGGIDAAPMTITKDYGTELGELPETARTGYTFKGWFTDKTGGTPITEETTMPAGDVTYYAQWAINTYTIEFDTAGGTEVSKIVQEFGTAIRKPAAPSKTGHTFIGWDQEVPETMPAENMKLTAQWKANQYTIVFNTDGGSKVEPITQDYGTAITAPANPTKEGYSFAGWNTEIPTTMPAENKLIKATWKINQYTIAFDTAGGSEIAAITQDYGTKVTAPADPTRTDYAFAGWDVEIPKTMPAADMTIKAQWEYIYTGWKTTDEGTTYFENGKQPYKNEFAVIDDVTYYFDEESYIVKGVTELEDGIYLFDQETGEFVEGDGLCEFDGDLYLLDDNKVVENAGLVKIDEDYYFFGEDHKAVKDQMVDVEDTKGYLPAGTYEFGPDGKMINVPVELTEEIVKLKDDSVVYDGTKKKPVVVVKGLDADAYEVTYADNLHAGTATVTVTGVKGCFGTVTLHFEITKAKNSWTEKLTIEGWTEGEKAQKPFADAQFGDVTYEFYADRNCTEKIAAPKAAGKYFVKAYVEGTEDYTGLESRAVKFIIDEPAKKPSDKPAGGAGGQDNDGNPPSTGDENQLTLWLGLAMASMMGAFSAYRRRRDEI